MDLKSVSPKIRLKNQAVKIDCAHNVPVKRLLSNKDLVVIMGATEWFWRSQIWDGQLPYVQVGRKMFIDREDVEQFIQGNKMNH
jgi:hypothetical protein